MKVGDKFISMFIGAGVGIILTLALLYYAEKHPFIFTFSPAVKLIVIVLLCTIASAATEAYQKASANEVIIDIYISAVVSLFMVTDKTLSVKAIQSLLEITRIIFISVFYAAWFSFPLNRDCSKVFKIRLPKKNKEEEEEEEEIK